MAIATVINFCTNDYRFPSKAVREALLFSNQVLIPISDHFFDGTAENRPLLESSFAENPACTFIEFAYNVKRLYTPYYRSSPEDEERTMKSMTWGKKHLCDWAAWLKEKAREMNEYEDVEPFFDPLKPEIAQPLESKMFSNVIRISADQAFRKEIDALY